MDNLKRAFNTSKAYRDHSWEEVEKELRASKGMISQVLNGQATSAPLVKRIKQYVYETGLFKSANDLCSDSEANLSAN